MRRLWRNRQPFNVARSITGNQARAPSIPQGVTTPFNVARPITGNQPSLRPTMVPPLAPLQRSPAHNRESSLEWHFDALIADDLQRSPVHNRESSMRRSCWAAARAILQSSPVHNRESSSIMRLRSRCCRFLQRSPVHNRESSSSPPSPSHSFISSRLGANRPPPMKKSAAPNRARLQTPCANLRGFRQSLGARASWGRKRPRPKYRSLPTSNGPCTG